VATTLGRMKEYYDRRAPEYDDWYLGRGLFAERARPGWQEEVEELTDVVGSLPSARTLDVACGTGFLTKHLEGDVVALDQSVQMLDEAARQAPQAAVVLGDALELPFPDTSFDRVFTAHFYGHLEPELRDRFLAEAARVAGELVVVDSSRAASELDEDTQTRVLNDGSEWSVYKRWFTGTSLAAELGGGDVLLDGRWFVAVRTAL
jgi:ubiquinone/menaquinone biosynthesis C-methylase UbiE